MSKRLLQIELTVASDEELKALRGALLAARASELAEVQRRSARHSFGYGSDAQRESMSAEASQAQRRHEMLDRLIAAVERASGVAAE
ncbi:MAG TPA: hypothetical protein VM344_07195 [Vitreimonas sp.]|nr:hypothetical protein [Vitreimonas sp.]